MVLEEAILGDGSFSVCRRCVLKETGQEFAVKIVSRRVDCSNEVELLTRCQGHPNVVQLVEVLQVTSSMMTHTLVCPIFY
jgi:ribosomal protein S6 kinase alpha-5